jgi:hypothetical protein
VVTVCSWQFAGEERRTHPTSTVLFDGAILRSM